MANKTRYKLAPFSTGRKFGGAKWMVIWLFLDKFHAPEWLFGIFFFLVGILFIAFLHDSFTVDEEEVDIQDLLRKEKQKQV